MGNAWASKSGDEKMTDTSKIQRLIKELFENLNSKRLENLEKTDRNCLPNLTNLVDINGITDP